MRHSLSNTMVLPVSGSDGFHVSPGWLGLPVRAKFAHAVAIFFRQRLRLRRVAGALLAALGVVEAEGEFGSMPCARILQHGRLPGEVVRVDRRGLLSCFSLAMRATLLRMASALDRGHRTVRQRADALFRMRLLHGGDQRGCLGFAVRSGEGGMPLRFGRARDILLPSSLTEPISIGTSFEISGAASWNDRTLMMRPSSVGPQPTRGVGPGERPCQRPAPAAD